MNYKHFYLDEMFTDSVPVSLQILKIIRYTGETKTDDIPYNCVNGAHTLLFDMAFSHSDDV